MSSLAELLCQERDPLSTVALCWDSGANSDRSLRWGELVVDVARLRERLAGQPSGGYVVLTEDAYCFAVSLLALWHTGRYAISPPNKQVGALRGPQSGAAGILTDRPDWFAEGTTLHPVERRLDEDTSGDGFRAEYEAARATFSPLDPDVLAVEFFTSGTTGDEKPVQKELRHLASEVEVLGSNWDDRVEGALLFSSAPHQHIYGMLFGVLWPLCAGHVFQTKHFLHAGELVPRLCAAPRSVLVSVPTHLRRLAQHAGSSMLAGRCVETFSSGGPLQAETARRIADFLGAGPIEVFGSTETGGIAWRRQTPPPEFNRPCASLWTPFPFVELSEDPETSTLRVRSPFVSAGTDEAFTTGDRVAFTSEGRFELLGRTDRVVKIGERRLDLTRMESELRGLVLVEAVSLTTLQREGEEASGESKESQERVAAAVVPSEEGWRLIRESGRRGLSSALRYSLADGWDPVLHPRYWRFVLDLPENAQGKTTQTLVRDLFRGTDWGSLACDWPETLGEVRSENAIERIVLVPSDLSCFPGHFPDFFLVPGVLQVGWGLALAEVLIGEKPRIERIESVKWLQPLVPGARARIRVDCSTPHRVDIQIAFGEETYTKARVRIAQPKA